MKTLNLMHISAKRFISDFQRDILFPIVVIILSTISFSAFACPNDYTNGGLVGNDQFLCGSGTPATIINVVDPSGAPPGTVPEYAWMQTTGDPTIPANWNIIGGTNTANYNPPFLTVTTHYRRCVRPQGCTDPFVIESNYVTMNILDPVITVIIPDFCYDEVSGTNYSCANATFQNPQAVTYNATWTPVEDFGSQTAPCWLNANLTPGQTVSVSVTSDLGHGCIASGSGSATVLEAPDACISHNASYVGGYCSTSGVTACVNELLTFNFSSSGSGSISYNYFTSPTYGAGNGPSFTLNMPNETFILFVEPFNTSTGCFGATYSMQVTLGSCVEDCSNGLDDDNDGFTDCADTDCAITVSTTGSGAGCAGTSHTLGATTGGENSGATFLWTTGATTPSITVAPNVTTTYSVTVTNLSGCTASSSETITVVTSGCVEDCSNGVDDDGDGNTDCADTDCGPVVTLNGDVTCIGSPVTLVPVITGNTNGLTYSWNTGPTTATITVSPTVTSNYIVTVTNANGCVDSDQAFVTVTGTCPCPTTAPSTTGASRCGTGNVTLTATPTSGCDELRWFTTASGGSSIFTGSSYTTSVSTTTTFYVGCYNTANACESNRTPVVATVYTNPSISLISSTNPSICAASDGYIIIGGIKFRSYL